MNPWHSIKEVSSACLLIVSFLFNRKKQTVRERVAVLIHGTVLGAELAKQVMKRRNGVPLVEPLSPKWDLNICSPRSLAYQASCTVESFLIFVFVFSIQVRITVLKLPLDSHSILNMQLWKGLFLDVTWRSSGAVFKYCGCWRWGAIIL